MGVLAVGGECSFLFWAGDRRAVLAERRMDAVGLDCVECIVHNDFLAGPSGRFTVDGVRWF